MHIQISVIIATAFSRTPLLLSRALLSIYKQSRINPEFVDIIIVDDNPIGHGKAHSLEYPKIAEGIHHLRKDLSLDDREFTTSLLVNARTSRNSGTGAWNTGIHEAFRHQSHGFVSILDDDDEYHPDHLNRCASICLLKPEMTGVFQSLVWKNHDGSEWKFPLHKQQITPNAFFVGNPGVQGSNMFFKTSTLMDVGGFDENLPSTTDRDLMIRYLWHLKRFAPDKDPDTLFEVIEEEGVIHHNHSGIKVNNSYELKHKGLELFYQKFKSYFSEDEYNHSLVRAFNFFQYRPSTD